MDKPIEKRRRVRVGVDTGGTFTDFVFEAAKQLHVFKLPSTPRDPSLAITAGLNRVAELTGGQLSDIEVVHGTTVGTNALLQRRGARTALVTTRGFEDVLAIGRQARPELYNLEAAKPPPLVPDELRLGVSERVSAAGHVVELLDESSLQKILSRLKRRRVESVAISLLFSFLRPEHEQRVALALKSLGVPLSISHRILPEYREFERTSTVVINAYLQPLMSTYLSRLAAITGNRKKRSSKSETRGLKLRVMQSSGGSISASAAAEEPVRTILSGPAGGVVGALRAARHAGLQKLVTFDMGGTSTDVALCDREGLRTTNEAVIAGLPVAVQVMDIHTVGAGGGSIARVDEGGLLRVGPESAGADPGPACYGRSFSPTVTDAHLVLGHFGGAGLLGGEFNLDQPRAVKALSLLAQDMSKAARRKVSTLEAAQGVLLVVNSNMERALRRISVERGYDPREFALLCFGGAGGLHAVDLARALRIPLVIAPVSAGALSAIGVLNADVIKDQSRTVMLEATAEAQQKLEHTYQEMERSARATLRNEGFSNSQQRHERLLAMRYKGQSFELELKQTRGDLSASFHRLHRARYGYAQESNMVQIVGVRVRSSGLLGQLREKRLPAASHQGFCEPSKYETVYIAGSRVRAGIYRRQDLGVGAKLKLPCIVIEYSATTLIPAGARATMDGYGNLIINVGI